MIKKCKIWSVGRWLLWFLLALLLLHCTSPSGLISHWVRLSPTFFSQYYCSSHSSSACMIYHPLFIQDLFQSSKALKQCAVSTGHFFISILVSIPAYLRNKPPTCFQSLHSSPCRAREIESLLMEGENKMCLEICEPDRQEIRLELLQSVNLMSRVDVGSSV